MSAAGSQPPAGTPTDPVRQAADDIHTMRVRGAAKIGRHAAKALASFADRWSGDLRALDEAARTLVAARPTAVTLPNAVAFVVGRARRAPEAERKAVLKAAALEFDRRAEGALAAIGKHGARLVPEGGVVLTICNSQGALTPLVTARKEGKEFHAIALETRPWRQGLLTARQLHEAGIPASLAVDSAMWHLLREAQAVFVGSDTIAMNGDVVNKVGTGALSILARERGVPFYVCAETFKVDPASRTGEAVPIEERESVEVVKSGEVPEGVLIRNPVFDVTPHRCVTGYVTELGVLRAEELAHAARREWEWDGSTRIV
jgi:ribose 1,5-bisphosphate isomerase